MIERHAVYANTIPDASGERVTFRIGRPTAGWITAQDRWQRLDDRRIGAGVPARPITVQHDGRRYIIDSLEVRAVDRHGRGLGSERHGRAFTVPMRAVRSAK